MDLRNFEKNHTDYAVILGLNLVFRKFFIANLIFVSFSIFKLFPWLSNNRRGIFVIFFNVSLANP